MEKKIRIGITGYGNLGRGVEAAIKQNEDMQLVAVFSRRDPESVGVEDKSVKVLPITEARDYQAEIDVMILCGGSATDLPEQGPEHAQFFNMIDSFDTHAKIPASFAANDIVATNSGTPIIIHAGRVPTTHLIAWTIGCTTIH